MRVFRLRNILKLLPRVRTMLSEAGIEPGSVNPSLLFPLLNGASLQDDEDLQTRWAALLANAANPAKDPEVLPSFVEVLKNISPDEARFLTRLFEYHAERNGLCDPRSLRSPDDFSLGTEAALLQFTVTTRDEYQAALQSDDRRRIRMFLGNFGRLGIVRHRERTVPEVVFDSNPSRAITFDREYVLTPFGNSFLLACQPPVRH